MTSSPPSYTPLPTSDDEKSSTAPSSSPSSPSPLPIKLTLERGTSDFHPSESPSPAPRTRLSTVKATAFTALLLLVGGGAVTGLFCEPGQAIEAWEKLQQKAVNAAGSFGCGGGPVEELSEQDGEGGVRGRWWKRASATGVEEFSTTTLRDGSTETLVRTTRPIVNPGGYTIGTIDGAYVPVSTTAAASASSAVSSTGNSKRSTGVEEFSTTTLRDGSVETLVKTTRPIVNPGGYTIGTLEGAYIPVSASPTSDAAVASSTALAKRDSTGVEELSTTTLRDGSVETLVKTTRPIINPGGYTIGTLEGAYVPVSSTANSTSAPASTAAIASETASSSIAEEEALPSASASASITASAPASTTSAVVSATASEDGVDSVVTETTTVTLPASTSTAFSTVTETITAAPSSSTVAEQKVRAKRFLEDILEEVVGVDGVEEHQTSTDKRGKVYTLVKTTRPIINQAGYTVGKLDGAWVDVAKNLPRPSTVTTLPSPAPTAADWKHGHEELRRRSEEVEA